MPRERKTFKTPLTSVEIYDEVVNKRKIGARNKNRAKAMENRIAKYLKGSRVPMSGAAAQWKGDCYVEFINNPGKYLIECKLSEQRSSNNDGALRLDFKWFPKMRHEAKIMNAKFAVLIIHYMDYQGDFVFIAEDDVQLLMTKYAREFAPELEQLTQGTCIDIRYKLDNILRTGYIMKRQSLIDSFQQVGFIQAARYQLPDGIYLVMPIAHFRMILADA